MVSLGLCFSGVTLQAWNENGLEIGDYLGAFGVNSNSGHGSRKDGACLRALEPVASVGYGACVDCWI